MKREDGFYHIKHGDQWIIAEYVDGEWYRAPFSLGIFDKAIQEIDERKITRGE